jgi:hypothetical protein
MSRIAFVTSSAFASLTDDDRLAVSALAELGLEAVPALWDDEAIDWTRFAAVVVRSPWDYFVRPAEFAAWLDRVEALGAPLWNPVELLRWNMDKRYLRELERSGIRCVPTHWAEDSSGASLTDVLRRNGWTQAVVKPVVSGGAYETSLVSAATLDDAAEAGFLRLAREGAMVQPFVEEIRTEGEWSLLFFAGEYSHAVLKRPADGDFRVQWVHGGRERAATPAPDLVATAREVLARVTTPWLYARVDICRHEGAWTLMELEMLEPSLFLAEDSTAAARFARAVAAIVSPSRRAA